MKRLLASESILIEEVADQARRVKEVSKGLSIGFLIKMIRTQIGMSQKALSLRAKVPQSTISRIEKGMRDTTLSTLDKLLRGLSCDLVIIPMLLESVDTIRRKQARKLAERHIRYLKGTMNLEAQQPDPKLFAELLKQEEERLLRGSSSKLWRE